MRSLALIALLLTACASGTVAMHADGSCEVRGIVIGRAELSAYRVGGGATEIEDPNSVGDRRDSRELCARVAGGSGSGGWYGFLGAVIGAAVAILPGVL